MLRCLTQYIPIVKLQICSGLCLYISLNTLGCFILILASTLFPPFYFVVFFFFRCIFFVGTCFRLSGKSSSGMPTTTCIAIPGKSIVVVASVTSEAKVFVSSQHLANAMVHSWDVNSAIASMARDSRDTNFEVVMIAK